MHVDTLLCGCGGFACCVDYFYCSCLGPPNAKSCVWGTPVSFGAYSFLSSWKTVQPQVRLICPIFNRPRPALVKLNSQVFFVPWPTSPKSKTVFSKEIRGKSFSAAKADRCMPIGYKIVIINKVNISSD